MPDRYDLAVFEVVDEGLLVLSEGGRERVYSLLEGNHQIRRREIPIKLEYFCKALEDLFGEGAKIFGKVVAKNLHSRLGLTSNEHENWTLVDYVKDAKKAPGGQEVLPEA